MARNSLPKNDKKGQAQRLTEVMILVSFFDYSGSLSWGPLL
jgi:hypothetical protein